ncbi:MAG: hypothetical protein WCQ41_03500 [Bacillota bacterium]
MSFSNPILYLMLFIGLILTFLEVRFLAKNYRQSFRLYVFTNPVFRLNMIIYTTVLILSFFILLFNNAYLTLLFFLYGIPLIFIGSNAMERFTQRNHAVSSNFLIMSALLLSYYILFIAYNFALRQNIPSYNLPSYYIGVPLFFFYQVSLMAIGMAITRAYIVSENYANFAVPHNNYPESDDEE